MEYVMAGDFDFLAEELRGHLMSWLIVATGLEKLVRLNERVNGIKTNKKAVLFRMSHTTLHFGLVSTPLENAPPLA
jgi:hypothetical protein